MMELVMRIYQAGELVGMEWFNAAEKWVDEEGGLRFCRLPLGMVDFLDKSTRVKVMEPSGVRLRTRSATTRLVMEVAPDAKMERHFDLVADGKLHQRVTLAPGGERVVFEVLDGREHDLVLWMNWQYSATRIKSIAVDEGTQLGPARAIDTPVMVFYGSSITHGRVSDGPTETWSSVAAGLMGVEPVNLGFGGACFAETTVARYLRGLRFDYLTCCVGINVVAAGTHSDRGLRMAVSGFLQVVREGHPDTPIAMLSTIFATRFEKAGAVGAFGTEASRGVVKEIVETFVKKGDKKLMYFDGLELLGEGDVERLFDGVHPDPAGQRLMGSRFAEKVWPVVKGL